MATTTTTPYMALLLPLPGLEPGPTYALDLNAAFTTVDQHTHISGQGLPVPTAGININADLSYNNLYNAISLRSLRFFNVGTVLSLVSDVRCLYAVGPDLWYNDGVGNQIQMTIGGAVDVSGSGNISGMGSTTATVVYTSINSLFTFNSATNTPANMQFGPINLGLNSASPYFVNISPNVSQTGNYNLVLPIALPASQKFMTLDASGNIAAPWAVDASTIVVAANVVKVPSGGITTTQIASGTIVTGNIAAGTILGTNIAAATIAGSNIAATTIAAANIVNGTITTTQIAAATITGTNIAAATVTKANQVAVGQQISSGSGSFTTGSASYTAVTNLTVTLTTSGRPVFVCCQGDGTDTDSSFVGNIGIWGRGSFVRSATRLSQWSIPASDGGGSSVGLGSTYMIDPVGAGTWTYTVEIKQLSGGAGNIFCRNIVLVAYEL